MKAMTNLIISTVGYTAKWNDTPKKGIGMDKILLCSFTVGFILAGDVLRETWINVQHVKLN